MCGIAGILYNPSSRPEVGHIHVMTSLIRHRGPDDEGYVAIGVHDAAITELIGDESKVPGRYISSFDSTAQLFLGHRRLSIIDTSPAGHQPMCTPDRRYWIVYNGEVYNHIDLKEELERLGHQFHSHSDTEVILAAYSQWGADCVSRFNGMFAFLLYDCKARKLIAARDRFGVKPLYYWISPSGDIAFGSEIKQFTVLPGWKPQMNGQRVYDFLAWGILDHTDETMFDGVYQLPPGHCVQLDIESHSSVSTIAAVGRLPIRCWWKLKPQPFKGTLADAAREFTRLLTDSVRLRLRADVPVGSCLSGGLDSSSIVCIMNRLLRNQGAHELQKTFSACADVKRFDEREFIDEVVRHMDVKPYYVYPSLDALFETQDDITWHQDEPFGSTSIYAQWNVFKLAADNGVKVMLDGQGADEQLAGYHGFFAPYLARLFRRGKWLRLIREMRQLKQHHGYSLATASMMIASMLLPHPVCDEMRRMLGKSHAAPDWLDMDRLGAEPIDPFYAMGCRTDSVQRLSYAQLTRSNLQMLLHWEDRDSMAHSVESRVPYLDYRLVEFVLGLPDSFKISDGVTKHVLREGMRGILPEKIRMRMDKLGFVTPEEVWVKEHCPLKFREEVGAALAASGGVLRQSALGIFDKMVNGHHPFNFTFWRLISFGAWIKRFGVKS